MTAIQIVLLPPLGGASSSSKKVQGCRQAGGNEKADSKTTAAATRPAWELIPTPRFFIAVDPTHRQVVLSIRGTAELSDMLTDLCCRSTPFCGGTAHEGVAGAARRLFSEVLPTLARLCGIYDVLSISCTYPPHAIRSFTFANISNIST